MKFNLKDRQPLILITTAIFIITVTAMAYWARHAFATDFMTATVVRGDLRSIVNATGTLQAVTTVQVGSQVSGTISALYADFNSPVHKGEIIAQIDPAIYQAQEAQARANLAQSRANLAEARAKVLAAEATLDNLRSGVSSASANQAALEAQRDDARNYLRREQELMTSGIIAARDLEVAQASYDAADARFNQAAAQLGQARVDEESAARAGQAEAQAQVKQAEAQVRENEAAVGMAGVNLNYTTIRSPIDGLVVSRSVDVGQTVAASLQAPTLFAIANDLTHMQVIANIDQADIGVINPSNQISFTVDTFPGENFAGTIKQIRLNAQNVENVVTYNVVIDVDNSMFKLMPGMTANLTITITERNDVLKIPNAALRFVPQGVTQAQIRTLLNDGQSAVQNHDEKLRAGDGATAMPTSAVLQGQSRIVWVLGSDHKAQARKVKLGITDGVNVEITGGNLKEGELVITGQIVRGANT